VVAQLRRPKHAEQDATARCRSVAGLLMQVETDVRGLADAVRDALVYGGKLSEDRVETRWTGESRQGVPTGDLLRHDIAIH
jgi:hypothetical protein